MVLDRLEHNKMESEEYDYMTDPIFQKIDKKIREILKLIKDNPDYSLACYFSKNNDEDDSIESFSVVYGVPNHIVSSMQCDLENAVENGNTSLYEGIFDMILETMIDQETEDPECEEVTSKGQVLH